MTLHLEHASQAKGVGTRVLACVLYDPWTIQILENRKLFCLPRVDWGCTVPALVSAEVLTAGDPAGRNGVWYVVSGN